MKEEFEDTKGVIRILTKERSAKNTYDTMIVNQFTKK
jgi:hypothetical protein